MECLTSYGYLQREYEKQQEPKEVELRDLLISLEQKQTFTPTHVKQIDLDEYTNNPLLGSLGVLPIFEGEYELLTIAWDHSMEYLKLSYGNQFWINKDTGYVIAFIQFCGTERYKYVGKYYSIDNSVRLIPDVFKNPNPGSQE